MGCYQPNCILDIPEAFFEKKILVPKDSLDMSWDQVPELGFCAFLAGVAGILGMG